MTPDMTLNVAFLFFLTGAWLFRSSPRVLDEENEMAADARSLTERAEKTTEDALKAGRQIEEGVALFNYGAHSEAVEYLEACGFRVKVTVSRKAPRPRNLMRNRPRVDRIRVKSLKRRDDHRFSVLM